MAINDLLNSILYVVRSFDYLVNSEKSNCKKKRKQLLSYSRQLFIGRLIVIVIRLPTF